MVTGSLLRLLLLASIASFTHSFAVSYSGVVSRALAPGLARCGTSQRPIAPLRGGSPLSDSKESYYETIDGVKYDRGILDAARAAVEGAGDGRVSKADAESILEKILDGKGVSQVEYRTAFLVLRDYSFTEQAQKLFIEKLATAE